jgi:hypothetical protein
VLYVGAFFNKQARESSLAKASLGAFPPISIAPRNTKLKRAVAFSRASRIFFHAAIYKCYDDKAIILAIYCDHPAARKCCLCGSGCPQCFCSLPDFAKEPLGGTMLMRTPQDVAAKKRVCCFTSVLMFVFMF